MNNQLIQQYGPIADMIAGTFGRDCEVVIHDLTIPQNSVVYTINSHVTGRQVGQSFDHLIKDVLLNQNFSNDHSNNYYFQTSDGRTIKSSTVLLRDEGRQLVGAMCVNIDTTRMTAGLQYLLELLPGYREPPESSAAQGRANTDHISEIADDLIDKIVGNSDGSSLRRDEKIEIVRFMEQKGIFLIKGAIDKVAVRLGISKVTVYSYLEEIKESSKSP